jgi:hypothetical protein
MKKLLPAIALAVSFAAGAVVSAQVRDWHDVREVRDRVAASLHDLEQIRAANNYDMHGQGLRAEHHLELAMRELDLAVRTAGR